MSIAADPARDIARRVRAREISAESVVQSALGRIRARNPQLNCFTTLLEDQALQEARRIDQYIVQGGDPGPLAGVPFGVKDLFDVSGVTTLAGSRILAANPPARRDATLVHRLRQAGAVLVGCQNMDEFAYGFTTENVHYGCTRNPHDPERVAGGSSGGSAAAVAAGLVSLSLGSDTNGSIRVPAAFCGIFGLKPTFGRLPRTGSFPFVHDLDHVGPFARNTADLALTYDLLQGFDGGDPACSRRPTEPALPALENFTAIRAGVLDDWFARGASPAAGEAVDRVARALGSVKRVTLPGAEAARAAAFCLTCTSGASLHQKRLQAHPEDFDPATRDRFLAGTLLPATVVLKAQRIRRWFAEQAAALFRDVDILLAPCAPDIAPLIGQKTMRLGNTEVPVRPNIGLYTQPISFIGLPVVAVPVWSSGSLPVGVQVIAPPWQEALALRVAAQLERMGIAGARSSDDHQ